jgi:abhydrolase domain-containing protein 17
MLSFSHRLVLPPLIIIAVIYAFLIFLAIRSDSMIFQPQPSSYRDADIPAPHQLIKLHSGTGTITAIYLPAEPPAVINRNQPPYPYPAPFTLLMSHGNAEDIGQNLELYREYARRGFAVFAYDYHGYGTSTGTPNERNVNLDEHAAWNYLVSELHIPPNRIIIHGTSVGCGPAVELAASLSTSQLDAEVGDAGSTRSPSGANLNNSSGLPAALVLQSPFRSAFTVLTRVPLLPWDKFNNARRIRDVRMPVLVVHGQADEVIPFSHGQAVFHIAAPVGVSDAPLTRDGGKQHLWIPNAGHNDIFILNAGTYFDKIRSFTAQLP